MATVDKESLKAAYDNVRSDDTETNWAFFGYQDDKLITTTHQGTEFAELKELFEPSNRAFAFLRMFTGDEMSRRAKFALISWCGPSVSPLKRARLSADKALVREVIQSYAVDITCSEEGELTEAHILDLMRRAGGANYGTGQ